MTELIFIHIKLPERRGSGPNHGSAIIWGSIDFTGETLARCSFSCALCIIIMIMVNYLIN